MEQLQRMTFRQKTVINKIMYTNVTVYMFYFVSKKTRFV